MTSPRKNVQFKIRVSTLNNYIYPNCFCDETIGVYRVANSLCFKAK